MAGGRRRLIGAAGVRGPLGFVRATAEALPVADGAAAVVTSGTAFHWFAPRPTLAEFRRALAPGGWVVLFWRYPAPGEPYMAVVAEVAARFGRALPFDQVYAHPEAPFHGSGLDARPPERIQSTLAFTAESFHGYISTVETFRRLTGEHHGAFLDALAVELRARWPQGFEERNEEFLFLAQKPA